MWRWCSIAVLCLGIALLFCAAWASGTHKYQWLGQYFSKVQTQQKVIALTFDDGPRGAVSQKLLDQLQRLNVQATFFLLGRQIQQYPELATALAKSGHQLANHSFSHYAMDGAGFWRYWQDIRETDRLLQHAGYKGPIMFRAPFGRKQLVLPLVLLLQNKTHVLWNINPRDYFGRSPAQLTEYVVKQAAPGSIVLLHDLPNTVAALPAMVAGLQQQGYQLVTVNQLMELNTKS